MENEIKTKRLPGILYTCWVYSIYHNVQIPQINPWWYPLVVPAQKHPGHSCTLCFSQRQTFYSTYFASPARSYIPTNIYIYIQDHWHCEWWKFLVIFFLFFFYVYSLVACFKQCTSSRFFREQFQRTWSIVQFLFRFPFHVQ